MANNCVILKGQKDNLSRTTKDELKLQKFLDSLVAADDLMYRNVPKLKNYTKTWSKIVQLHEQKSFPESGRLDPGRKNRFQHFKAVSPG